MSLPSYFSHPFFSSLPAAANLLLPPFSPFFLVNKVVEAISETISTTDERKVADKSDRRLIIKIRERVLYDETMNDEMICVDSVSDDLREVLRLHAPLALRLT
ncbi:hypothetical protein PanWU01x14_323260, partial [Parasponia andersonii]